MDKKCKKPSYEDLERKIKVLKKEAQKQKKIEKKLEWIEDKYRNILELVPIGYFELDLEGNYTFFNKIVPSFHKRSSKELIGMNYRDYMSKEEAERIYDIYHEVYQTEKTALSTDNKVIKKDGSIGIVTNSISLLRNDEGDPVGFYAFVQDVTEIKESETALQKSRKQYLDILETMEDEYYEIDLNGTVLFCNSAMIANSGYLPEELVGMNYKEFTSKEVSERIYEIYNNVFRTGKPAKSVEYEVIKKDGSPRTIEMSISLLKDLSGKGIGFRGISRDITERKKVEKYIRESEEKFRKILETMEEGYFEVDLSGKLIFVNDAECRLHMRSREEMIGYGFRENVSPEEQKRIYNFYNKVYRTGESLKAVDWELKRKDGSTIYVETSVSLIKNDKGEPIGFRGISRDVTERKKAVDALGESERKYRNILETMEEGYLEVDLAGNYMFVNEALCKIHGYSQEELIGMNNQEYSTPEEAKRIYKIYNEVYRTGVSTKIVDYKITRKDGSIRNMETSISLMNNEKGEPAGFSGITRDVTERKKAEDALRKSEEKYRTILETMEEGYYEVDLAGNFMFFNPAELRIHGIGHDDLMGLNNRDFSSAETAERVYKIFNEVYRTGVPTKVIDYEIITKDGSRKTLETSASLFRDDNGKPIGFRGISRDVTDKKKAEKALRDSEEKYRLLVENANDGIFVYQDETLKFPNPKAIELTGYSTEELNDIAFTTLVHPDDEDDFIDWQKKQLHDDKQSSNLSFRIKNKKDETLWIEMISIKIGWEGNPAELIFLRDITAQKKIEVQLLQAQKMEALGTLAGGIAHDFNNLLMGIQGNASLIQLALGDGNPHSEKLKSIEHLVTDGSELTKQLLGVARGGKYEVAPTNINRVIEKSADLFGRTRKEISIHKVLKKDLWVVDVDRSQIEQVLLNLYVNSWHAMPEGGDLYIETKNVTLDEYYTKGYGLEPGKYIRISVTDNGMGMDEETRKRVFDPFFTTKEMGRGTGLGLASAYGIIRNHKGIINVYSEIKQGTTFNMYFPISGGEVKEEKYSDEKILTGTETIVFVDDEDTIIEVGKQLLEILGYNVILTKSGKETIDVYQQEKETIDLIILDMIMPGMSGGDTYDKLKEIDTNVKVLLSSGYSLNGQAEKILERGCKGFIQKPFNLEELSKKIRDVLDH